MISILTGSLANWATISGTLVLASASNGLPDRITLGRPEYGQILLSDSPLILWRMDGGTTGYFGFFYNSGTLGNFTGGQSTGATVQPVATPVFAAATGTYPWPWQLRTIPVLKMYQAQLGTGFAIDNYVTGVGATQRIQFDETQPFTVEMWANGVGYGNHATLFGNANGTSPTTNGGFGLRGYGSYGASQLTIESWASASAGGFEYVYPNAVPIASQYAWHHFCIVYHPNAQGQATCPIGSGQGNMEYPSGSYDIYVDGRRSTYGFPVVGVAGNSYKRAMPDAWYINVVSNVIWSWNNNSNYSHFALYDKALTPDQVWNRWMPFGSGSAYFSATFANDVVVSGVLLPSDPTGPRQPLDLMGPSGSTTYNSGNISPYGPTSSGSIRMYCSVGTGSYAEYQPNASMSLPVPAGQLLNIRIDMRMTYGDTFLPYIQAPSIIFDDGLSGAVVPSLAHAQSTGSTLVLTFDNQVNISPTMSISNSSLTFMATTASLSGTGTINVGISSSGSIAVVDYYYAILYHSWSLSDASLTGTVLKTASLGLPQRIEMSPSVNYNNIVLADGPVMFWPVTESNVPFVNLGLSGSTYDLTSISALNLFSGPTQSFPNQSIRFNTNIAQNAVSTYQKPNTYSDPFTIEFWMSGNNNPPGGQGVIFATLSEGYGGWEVYTSYDPSFWHYRVFFYNGSLVKHYGWSVPFTPIQASGTWNHVMITSKPGGFAATNGELFFNGVSLGTGTIVVDNGLSPLAVLRGDKPTLGRRSGLPSAPEYLADSRIANVAIYETALNGAAALKRVQAIAPGLVPPTGTARFTWTIPTGSIRAHGIHVPGYYSRDREPSGSFENFFANILVDGVVQATGVVPGRTNFLIPASATQTVGLDVLLVPLSKSGFNYPWIGADDGSGPGLVYDIGPITLPTGSSSGSGFTGRDSKTNRGLN